MRLYKGFTFEELKELIKDYFSVDPKGKTIKPTILHKKSVFGFTRLSYVSMNDLIQTFEMMIKRDERIKTIEIAYALDFTDENNFVNPIDNLDTLNDKLDILIKHRKTLTSTEFERLVSRLSSEKKYFI